MSNNRSRNVTHPLHQLYSAPLIDSRRLSDEVRVREILPGVTAAHNACLAAMEIARQSKVLGSSLGCNVVLEVPANSKALRAFKSLESELANILVVSEVRITTDFVLEETEWAFQQPFAVYGDECKAWVLPPTKHKCPRCWRHVAEKQDELCGRCVRVVEKAM